MSGRYEKDNYYYYYYYFNFVINTVSNQVYPEYGVAHYV